jgi:gluconokinase
MASASGLFSHRSLQWDEAMLAAAGVQAEQLGELVDFDDRSIGLVTPYCRRLAAFADLPWFPAMADGVCSNLGSGCVDESRFALNLGTSGALRAISPRSNRRVPEGLFCYVVDRDRRLLGGAISNCGNLRRWLLDTIQPGGDLDRQLPRMEPDAHGLTMLPFLAGERAPFWPADATGAILGLRASSTPLDIVRAGLDAVCYQLALIHARLRTTLHRTRCIVASGGGSASDWWMQMMADTADIPVRRSGVAEASSRGAALLALEALGVIRASKQVPSPRGRTFVPNAERGLTYRRALNRYTRFCELLSAKLEDRFSSLRRVVSL